MRNLSLDDHSFGLEELHPRASDPRYPPANFPLSITRARESKLPGLAADAISSSIVQAAIVAAADLDTMIQLTVTHKWFAGAVKVRLVLTIGHLLLRPTQREDIRQDLIVMTTSGPQALATAGWWIDTNPDMGLEEVRTVTLPVRRAAAALRWLCLCAPKPRGACPRSRG